ncbi:MAG TPA: DNA-formamidopyrimidine glycosylase family protein [Solirubrobacteraceae bacterium]|nr:DNA-formamidopyrimidine glycosylase family protein [Solirubrobacteraceae bacterium]
MPELPEVEITARRLDTALRGAQIESALSPGINALKTFDPPLSALAGQRITAVRRRGKNLIIETDGELALLMHLMSAGRLQLFDKRAGPRDRTSRVLVRVRSDPANEAAPGPELELRLREFGSKQAAWTKLLPLDLLEQDEALTKLGPEAWPEPPALGPLLAVPRPLHALLRDQHVIAGIGRSWVDEILWEAKLSPFKRGSDLSDAELRTLAEVIAGTLGRAIEHYEQHVELPIPDRLPMPLQVHRHQGEPCPRCGTTLEAVHFEDYVIAYCPQEQTDGRVLKDRRMSRLLR